MNIGGHYKLFEKEYEPLCNYLRCTLSSPYLTAKSDTDCWADEFTTIKLDFDTKISFTYSSMHWTFMFYILGFGICLQRQWDY